MRRASIASVLAVLVAVPAASGQSLPSPPPSTDFGSFGKLRVTDRLSASSPQPELWASHVTIRRAKNDKLIVESTLPFEGTFSRGRYRLKARWDTCAGGYCTRQPQTCSKTIELRRGDHNKVKVIQSLGKHCEIQFKDKRKRRKRYEASAAVVDLSSAGW